jgi:hypothetical protein
LLLVTLMAGCGGDDNGTGPDGTPGNPLTLPFDVGNRWEYTLEEISGGDSDMFSRTDSITGTREFGGKTYWVLRSTVQDTASEAYLRQEDQVLLQWVEIDLGLPEDHPIAQELSASVPWKIAEFTSLSGSTWNLVDVTGNVEVEGASYRVNIKITISNEGRSTVETTAGKFEDVYQGHLVQIITVTPPPPLTAYSLSTRQDMYMKDGVGFVREKVVINSPNGEFTITSELTSYDLEP